MSKLIFDDGIRKQVAHEDGEGGLVVETIQDVTSIVEANKAEYNATDYGARWGDFTKVASVPMTVIDDLNKKGIMQGFAVRDTVAFKRWLNDPENRFFRTRPGVV
ncbi:MAG: hypothetical protein NBV65_02160 [Burkholderiaceae bacterium]|nr:hypothetical protein [Burkholderiaceae bacterium]